ncbi:hypothetical protein B0A48_17619 [Cryoendolithus antarcticus]|uniref:AAA+ ATPase domain-containing protein n=1 Tax=Cryoendolithus antarcticus TaxID=1507870 RepID=A0A1V8SBI7_9PEZI|nr:hypothetical protein B0A48_17619 [Cryoendolithus antarcticus]
MSSFGMPSSSNAFGKRPAPSRNSFAPLDGARVPDEVEDDNDGLIEDGAEDDDDFVLDNEGDLAPNKSASTGIVGKPATLFDKYPLAKLTEAPGPWYGTGLDERDAMFVPHIKYVTERYDGRDFPAPSTFRQTIDIQGKAAPKDLSTAATAIVQFPIYTDNDGNTTSFGSFGGDWWIQIDPVMHSQRPALRLRIKGGDGVGDCWTFLYPDCVRRDAAGSIKNNFNILGGTKAGTDNVGNEEVLKARRGNNLVEYRMQRWTADDVIPGIGLATDFPRWVGISEDDIDAIADQGQNTGAGPGYEDLSNRDKLIWCLQACADIRIFRQWPDRNWTPLDNLQDWMHGVFQLNARLGYFWFYRLQDRHGALRLEDFDFKSYIQPRWLATQARLEFTTDDNNKQSLSLSPVKVNGFVPNAKQNSKMASNFVYPDSATLVFEYIAGLERNQAHQEFAIAAPFANLDFSIKADVRCHDTEQGVYFLALKNGESKVLKADSSLRPKKGCRVEINVRKYDGNDHPSNYVLLKGQISADFFGTGADVNCVVEGKPDLAPGTYAVSVEMKSDPTPCNCQKAALIELLYGCQDRKQGPDFNQALLQAPATRGLVTNSLALELAASPGTLETILATLKKRRNLNDMQFAAAKHALTGKKGITLLVGPPGAGKTETAAAIAEAHYMSGKNLNKRRPILYVASSNYAVQQGLIKLKSHMDTNGKIYTPHVVHYKGSFLSKPKERKKKEADTTMIDIDNESEFGSDDDDDGEEDDADVDAVARLAIAQEKASKRAEEKIAARQRRRERRELGWDMANAAMRKSVDDSNENSFYLKRHNWIASVATLANHSMQKNAVNYLDLLKKKEERSFPKNDMNARFKELRALEWELSAYYFENVVDIVFCTSNTAARGMLRTLGKFKVIIQDEAALTAIPDAATPLASFIDRCYSASVFH